MPSGPIMERGAHVAARVSAAAALVGLCVAGVVVTHPWSLLEGGDVLFARRGVAPVAMQWLEGIELTARPPEYLHEGEIHEIDHDGARRFRSVRPSPCAASRCTPAAGSC